MSEKELYKTESITLGDDNIAKEKGKKEMVEFDQ